MRRRSFRSSGKVIHPKLCNITRSLISRNLRERSLFKFHSLLSHFSSLYLGFCRYCEPPKKPTHTLELRYVSICRVSPFASVSLSSSSYDVTCWMLVHAYATSSGKAKWSGPHRRRREDNECKFQSVTCYTNSIISRIHVNTTNLYNITCTLVATGVW